MWSYFDKGGLFMWPLLALSILGVTVMFWRWWALRQATSGLAPFMKDLRAKLVNRDVAGAIAVCDRHGGPVAAIVKAGLLRYGRPKDEIEMALQDVHGSFDRFIWQFVGGETRHNAWRSIKQVPAKTVQSDAMSKALSRVGFKFVGSTICYAYMQAAGMVNDHEVGCFRYAQLRGSAGPRKRTR